jgi:hypothetical protein
LDQGGGAVFSNGSPLEIRACTFAANAAQDRGAALYCYGSGAAPTVDHSIMAFHEGAAAVYTYLDSAPPTLSCCDVFGNARGDWVNRIADQAELRGNFSEDPLFCDAAGGVWTLHAGSPCAPPGITDCGLVGALGVGCDTVAIKPSTWARVKEAYR